jgi:hypothetical protein
MANMSYCRFENTYRDLLDCLSAMNDQLSDREKGYRDRLVDVCKEIIEEYELTKMSESDDVWGDDEWGVNIVVDEWNKDNNEPEYDGAGFTEDDRIVNGEYRVIDTQNDNNPADMESQDGEVFGENKI